MSLAWLHISDFHIRSGDPYDRDVVLRALVGSVKYLREHGRAPNLIFATGDIAHSGQAREYELATTFFNDLLAAAGLQRRQLYVVPGNHDVDRRLGRGLVRTHESREEADDYFDPSLPKPHLTQKLGAFSEWHNRYFEGIRTFPADSTCGPVEVAEVRGLKLGVLPINTALFCQDDNDHEKLWVGRRCLDAALKSLKELGTQANLVLMHHPLDWLHSMERGNIKAALHDNVDFVLHGHLHETDFESVLSVGGQVLYCAAGAAYQTRRWPNRAAYATIKGDCLVVFPIRYEDQPHEVWTVDPSLFPQEPGHERSFPIPRLAGLEAHRGPLAVERPPAVLPKFRSNIPSRRNLPFVGRDDLLEELFTRLGEPSRECILVLHGQPGVGKSELAREFARRQRERYPGGTFFIDASSEAAVVDIARVGRNILGLEFPPGLPLKDQCEQTLHALGADPVLLIYDNVTSAESVLPWLPAAGMACHVLMTTCIERWDPGWLSLEVKPLSREASLELIQELAGREVAARYGEQLAALGGGLPVQICPAAATLSYEARRSRLESAQLTLTREAAESFRGVYERLERPAQLLLHAAAVLNTQRILRDELFRHLSEGVGWSQVELERLVDQCKDLHLVEGHTELRMHQLFAAFVLATPVADEDAPRLRQVRVVQGRRVVEVAKELAAHPANADLAATLTTFPVAPEAWAAAGNPISIKDGETVGRALYEIGRFDDARPWFERAVEAKQKGAVHGRVDHESLGRSLHCVGYCLSSTGKFEEALPWYERAVEAAQQGDVHGRVDHASLGRSLHCVGYCLSRTGKFEEALPWFERAVEAKQQGAVHGRVDHESLGTSLHCVGYCLSSTGKFEEALPWYERAVEATQQGDVHGRVDHESLGTSLHQVGLCLSRTGKFEEARAWYERAVEAKQQGDVHGRVDHESLRITLREGARVLRHLGRTDQAEAWERAAATST